MAALLSVRNLEVVYNDATLVLRGISLRVDPGSVVALLGANGAGKTTLLRAISGLLPLHRGAITKGDVELEGASLLGTSPVDVVQQGVAQVLEGRRVFAGLTVEENLRLAASVRRIEPDAARRRLDWVHELFPVLADRRRERAGLLSGGEQQMLVVAQAMLQFPRLMLLDEPSLGLAPRLVRQITEVLRQVCDEAGTSLLLVEQSAGTALSIADYAYVMESGKIVKDGTADELREDRDIQEFYLGVSKDGRRSFRDVKTYRRKKRWSS
jgi:branched-chain amino acid transport system ATP-binding protein